MKPFKHVEISCWKVPKRAGLFRVFCPYCLTENIFSVDVVGDFLVRSWLGGQGKRVKVLRGCKHLLLVGLWYREFDGVWWSSLYLPNEFEEDDSHILAGFSEEDDE